MSAASRKNTKQDLVDATIRLVSTGGMASASVRSITREAGITERALYRHYPSKEALWCEVYTRIVEAMAADKATLFGAEGSAREKLTEWIHLTYAYYDGNRDAFNYVLLAPLTLADSLGEIYTRQGKLFCAMYEHLLERKEVREYEPRMALVMFSGLSLSIPKFINEGQIKGPALAHVQTIAEAVWRVLGKDSTDHQNQDQDQNQDQGPDIRLR